MTESADVQLARLEEQTKSLKEMLAALVEEMKEAAKGRKGVYEKLEQNEREMIRVCHRLDKLEVSVEAIKPTTAELERTRDRVVTAGRVGIALWKIGQMLLGAAAGAAAAWYSMTGRPPP